MTVPQPCKTGQIKKACHDRCHCRVRPFGCGDSARGPFVGISVSCLDDATVAELAQVPVTFVDGWHDAWNTPPQAARHL